MKPLPMANVVGRSGIEGQGPFFEISLKIDGDIIQAASFRTIACPWANAVGSALVKIAETKKVSETINLTSDQITLVLGEVPRDKRIFPALAVSALKNALAG